MKQVYFLITTAVIFASCGRFGNRESGDKKEERIVCVSKHLTEMMFALGKGYNIVACDLSSTYPDSAKLLPTVGYHRMLSAEGIISQKPDLVMHSNDIGPENVIPQLQKAGLNVKAYGGAGTIDSAKMLLKQLGDEFGASAKADAINNKLDADMKLVADAQNTMALKDTPTVMIIHFGRANNIYFIMSGRNGPGDKMIQYAGGKPVKYEAKGAREISAEAVATSNPDIILATDYGYDRMGSVDKFKTVPGVGLTNAAKNNRIYRFEEHDLIYFGPRSGQNILKLMKLIHPEIK